jgi:hypothetical protein
MMAAGLGRPYGGVERKSAYSGATMRRSHWIATIAGLFSAIPLVTTRAEGQSPSPLSDTVFFVTTQGKDTVAIEHYVRTGNTITGQWIQHQGGVYIHDYALVLGNDGWPAQYVMTVYTAKPRHTFLLSVTYGSDSATRIIVRDSIALSERVPAQNAYPLGALSILGEALALERARRAHTDSTLLYLDRAEVRGLSTPLPVKFFGADSARIGAAVMARVDRNGELLALREGPRDTRRVASLDVVRLVAGFVTADSVARASRVAITLLPAALQRFVGEYALNPRVTIQVALDGDKLMVHVGQQPPTRLVPASPTTFFLEATLGVTVEFETDATANVTALTIIQSGARQRAAKQNR